MTDRNLWQEFLDLPSEAASVLAGALVQEQLRRHPQALAQMIDEAVAVTP